MIFENELTTRGTKRKTSHYCKKGKKIKQIALRDMKNIFKNATLIFNRESDLLKICNYKNIIYLH